MSEALEKQFGLIDFINDIDRGANTLPEFLKYSENVIALINAVLKEFQELYEAQKDVYSTVNIYEAVGVSLDNIYGEILDLKREAGQLDEDYRLALLARVAQIARSGEITVLKSIFKNIVQGEYARLYEYKTASFRLFCKTQKIFTDEELQKIRDQIALAKQGGNHMELAISNAENTFTLVESNPQLNSPIGLSSDTFSGGTLAKGF